jgi:lipopolysaccharide/colanic/teichoic acid biosynthesis glycosyltransferase
MIIIRESKLMITFKKYLNLKIKSNLSKINSINEFNQIINIERYRADRNTNGFSLILLNMKNCIENIPKENNWVNLINSRVRNYDKVGWFDENHLAILLPETLGKNAKKVVKKIFTDIENEELLPDYKIISYPVQVTETDTETNKIYLDIETNCVFAHCDVMPLWKRSFDIIFSLICLVICSPLMLLTAFLIKIVSPGPVFFRQKRVGQSGRMFNLLKFRTMKVNNNDLVHREYIKKIINYESNGHLPLKKIFEDKRIISFGEILRNTCIDELPQFLNVLRGEMSIVGPRPCIDYEAEEFLNWHKRRFDIVPGITGLWQVSGKNNTTFKEMIRLDLEYSRRRSFIFDLLIIIKTPAVILDHIKYFKINFQKKYMNIAINNRRF